MTAEILIAILSLVGTMIGSLGGIIASAKLTNYRISELEKKVETHNNFAKRVPILEERIKVVNHRINDLEHTLQ